MSKFSEIPYYILEDFLEKQVDSGFLYNEYMRPVPPNGEVYLIDDLEKTYIPTFDGYNQSYIKTGYETPTVPTARLWGGKTGIIAGKSYGFTLFLKTDIKYYRLSLKNVEGSPANDFFTFVVDEESFIPSELTMNQILGNDIIPELGTSISLIGSELYFQKESLLYDFIDNYNPDDYYEVDVPNININKFYLYFGNLYSTNNNEIIVKFEGYKTYANNLIPENNRNTLLTKFINLCFDNLYTSQYNKFKDILTLSDPKEVDINFLEYIAKMYKMTIPEYIDDDKKREYAAALPELLKRKGTYYSLYIIWKVLCSNTTNYLNIYERWNNWPIPNGEYPIENFSDIFYIFNPLYKASVPRTGAGAEYYFSDSGVSYITRVATYESTWTANHSQGFKWPFVQVINDENEVIIPNNVSFDSDVQLTVDFGDDTVSGKVMTFTPSWTGDRGETGPTFNFESINEPSNSWTFNHNLHFKYPLVQIVDLDNNLIIPKEVIYDDDDNITVTFSDTIQGTIFTGLTFTDPNNTTFYYQNPTLLQDSIWSIEHNLNTSDIIVYVIEESGGICKQVTPEKILIVNSNNIEITFSKEADIVSGHVIIFSSLGLSPYPDFEYNQYMLSPHYLAEIDLTNEPFGDDYIINSQLINELISRWEELRPVCKYAHYRMIVSPITNFSGRDIELYVGTNKTGHLSTRCCKPVRETILEDEPSVFIYRTYANRVLWTVNHQLYSSSLSAGIEDEHVLVQCYDLNQNRIIPKEIIFDSGDIVSILWDTPQAGYAYVSKSEYVEDSTTAPSLLWTVSHNLSAAVSNPHGMMIQQTEYNSNNTVFMPAIVKIIDDDSFTVTLSSPETGYVSVSTGSYEITASSEITQWTINHGLNSAAIQAQFYDEKYEEIYPKTVQIIDENIIKITFEYPVKPGVVIKKIGLKSEEKVNVYNALSYVKVGNSGSLDWDAVLNNDLELPYDYTYIVDPSETNDRYFGKVVINTREDISITEFGIFDSDNDILFYTHCDEIFKPKNVDLIIWYRIDNTMS